MLRDAAVTLGAHSGKRPEYCYKIGRGPGSGVLGHVTGLLSCFYVKIFLPSIFTSVDFCSGMSCIVVDNQLAEKNVFNELGTFFVGKIQGYSFRPPKEYQPTRQAFWCTRILHIIVWKSGSWDYCELSIILHRAVKGEYFAKGTEICKLQDDFWKKSWKNWKITVFPKFKVALMKKFGTARVTHSDTGPHFTVQRTRQNSLVTE